MIYLIQYDRSAAKLVTILPFTSWQRQQAEEARLETELRLLGSGVSREVVLLEASNEEELRKTHRRYFVGLEELLKRNATAKAA